jgi:hypothetical protein
MLNHYRSADKINLLFRVNTRSHFPIWLSLGLIGMLFVISFEPLLGVNAEKHRFYTISSNFKIDEVDSDRITSILSDMIVDPESRSELLDIISAADKTSSMDRSTSSYPYEDEENSFSDSSEVPFARGGSDWRP